MQDNNRSIRIRTKVNSNDANDKFVNVKLDNDIDIIELLSLKIDTTNFYKTHSSDYGCVAGRVLANGGVGIPNAKISVFVALNDSETDDQIITSLYPFSYLYGKNNDGIRYNLLPEEQVSECHTPVGTFPSKRMVLDDNNVIEVFDKYYKYTTRSNDAGDYMIFGVPVGDQNIHVDIDLSDIGMLSQRPRDMIYKGYNVTQFENANKFKYDTNIDSLSQIISQNQSVYIFPFWGDTDNSEIKITRNDIDIQYKFEPTCVFLGSLITDNKSEGISKKCIATDRMGKMDKLTTGSGTIEMIRKTPDGGVEEKQIQGNQLIDGNGTWCYQIPMNLDYFMTDEYGNFVPSDDKEKGIPTRARVRFRVSLTDFQSDYENNHLAKVLVPNNPRSKDDIDYHFGSATLDDDEASKSYRDLFWNKIYSVKQYIPRIQKGNNQRNKKFTGIKNINVNGGNNPIPYNNMRVNLTFMFVLQCAIIKAIILILGFVNWFKAKSSDDMCAAMGDGICPELENWYFAPRCESLGTTIRTITNEEQDDKESIDYTNRDGSRGENYCITKSTSYLFQCIEINLAMEYEVIQFDFYNDWINGMLYIPHWFVNYRKKRSYLFGLIRRKAKLEACKEDSFFSNRRYTQQCALEYSVDDNGNYTKVESKKGCSSDSKQKCHKGKGRKSVNIFGSNGGIVHTETTLQNQSVFYFKPAEWLNVNNNNYSSKCLLFATDIILLGSLDDCDKDGLPKLFTELTSSTYVMPSNLASTNMDSQSFMYGWSDKNSRCTGTNPPREEALTIKEQTFEEYQKWIKETDDYEDNYPDDEKEYPITESAGIDWGYNGPGQGKNDLGNLYFPGGHFLGISCFNSEVNIKSCVNLSRICEIGSIMSQRQSFLRKLGNDFVYDYLVPNGLISKFEITDSNFRREFATLNYNGLKTKVDSDTQYRKYDLTYIHPVNFNGELSGKIKQNSAPYMAQDNDDTSKKKDSKTMAYKRVNEEPSSDYYYFRMGLSDYEDATSTALNNAKKNKFMQSYYENGKQIVALPMYENSYYFYFGLNDGNTAIDRFFKDFYAPCSTSDEDMSYFNVVVNDDSDICSGNGVSATVNITNVESPYTVSLLKEGKKVYLSINDKGVVNTNLSEVEGYKETIMHNFSTFIFNGLSSGSYVLEMKAKDYVEVEYPFNISDNINSEISGIDILSTNFTVSSYDETVNFNSFNQSKHGSITFNNVYPNKNTYGLLIANDDKYVFVKTHSFEVSSFADTISKYIDLSELVKLDSSKVKVTAHGDYNTYVIPAWKGNDTYYVFLLYRCGSNTRIYRYNDFNITMPVDAEVYFGDTDLSYQLIKSVEGNSSWANDDNWPQKIFESDKYSEKQKWNLKKSLFFNASMFSGSGGDSINIKNDGIEDLNIKGNAETEYIDELDENRYYHFINVTESQVNALSVPKDYKLSIRNFLLPTSYFKTDGHIAKYEKNGYNKNGWNETNKYGNVKLPSNVKSPYIYTIAPNTTIKLPSIYRPFYFTGVMLVDEEEGYKYYSISVTNIITYNNRVGGMKINGKNCKEPSDITFAEKFNGDYTQVKCKSEPIVTNDYTSGDASLSFSITEGSPGKNYNGGINVNSYGESLSCHFPCKENDNDFYYTEGIKFFYCTTNDKTVSVNGTSIVEGNENVAINKDSTIIVNNVTSSDIVKVHFREQNTGNRGIITNLNKIDAINDNSGIVKNGKIDANGKTVFDTVDIDASPTDLTSCKHVIIDLNDYDTVTLESNIEYNLFSVNYDGLIRIEQITVPIIYEDADEIKPKVVTKTFTPKVCSRLVIWWNTSYKAGSTFKISYNCNSKYNCGITSNKGLTMFSAKWLQATSLYLDYVEVGNSIVLGCKINGTQYKTKSTGGDETKRYISTIAQGRVPKDYSSKDTSFWNGIFGNASFNVIDISNQLTIAKITERKQALGCNMWDAFNDIINNTIKQDIFAVYDKWTSIGSYIQVIDDEDVVIDRYTNDHSKIWKYVTPDLNTISIVKYFPKKK